MKILVTGGAGFIGSHVVDAYIKAGHDVVVVDNLTTGSYGNINPKARLYLLDVRSSEIEKVFALEQPDVVNHHAAQKSVPKSVQNPILDAELNVIGLLALLENCIRSGVKRFIFSSSGGALASDASRIPTTETDVPQLMSPYAITKFTGEKYLSFYAHNYGLTYVALRYANVYGPRQVPEGECGVVAIFMENIINSRPSMLMAYDDMPKGCSRDYVYVEDIARANALALSRGDNLVLNIGSGKELYIADAYENIARIAESDLPLVRTGQRPGDIRRSAIDSTSAHTILGWYPETAFKEGIKQTYEHMAHRS